MVLDRVKPGLNWSLYKVGKWQLQRRISGECMEEAKRSLCRVCAFICVFFLGLEFSFAWLYSFYHEANCVCGGGRGRKGSREGEGERIPLSAGGSLKMVILAGAYSQPCPGICSRFRPHSSPG